MGRPATDTRQKLIETATDLIWRDSYKATSVDEICKKSGVQKGSFYHFFPSKAHLALETMDSCMKETEIQYDEIFSTKHHPLERFRLMSRHLIDQQKDILEQLGHVCGCPFATLGSELAAQDDEIGQKIVDICAKKSAYYQGALRDLVKDGLISSDIDIAVKANDIFAFIVGQLIMARINNDLKSIEDHFEQALFNLIGINKDVLLQTQELDS